MIATFMKCHGEVFNDMKKKIIFPIHAVAAFSDPAYMYSDNFKVNDEMEGGKEFMLQKLVESYEKEAFTREVEQYQMKMPELFTDEAITMLKLCHPRKSIISIFFNNIFNKVL